MRGYAPRQPTGSAVARGVLSDALVAGEAEGAVGTFVGGGARIKSLLEVVGTGRVSRLYLDRVRAAFRPLSDTGPVTTGHRPGSGVASAELVEPLSDRELEVLRLLASGMSNRQIADDLVVALDTVKKHVSHIFAKLGASSRTQAAARARELQLL